jgi:hypothetical protein
VVIYGVLTAGYFAEDLHEAIIHRWVFREAVLVGELVS